MNLALELAGLLWMLVCGIGDDVLVGIGLKYRDSTTREARWR